MARFTQVSRRIVIGLVVVTLTLGGLLLQPAAALAGISTSPGGIASITDGTSNTIRGEENN